MKRQYRPLTFSLANVDLQACVISMSVAIELGNCGNWSWQSQDPWKYLDASSPHRKFNQVLRPESHLAE
jgi:hypothetical protein